MATKQSTIDELLELLMPAGHVTAKKMFGEYCLYLNEKPVGLVCDNCLFVKPTTTGREMCPKVKDGPPYPGAKPHLKFPPASWDAELLCQLLKATFQELPASKPRKKRPAS